MEPEEAAGTVPELQAQVGSASQDSVTVSSRSDCHELSEEEGGDGEAGDCYRHQDRRNVFSGICLAKVTETPAR